MTDEYQIDFPNFFYIKFSFQYRVYLLISTNEMKFSQLSAFIQLLYVLLINNGHTAVNIFKVLG